VRDPQRPRRRLEFQQFVKPRAQHLPV
jgi:hypothetical protein